jgi:TRAP-type C4-dicarboxylate transport system substrate-binding protein
MKGKHNRVITFGLAGLLIITLIIGSSAGAGCKAPPSEKITWRFGTWQTPTHWSVTEIYKPFIAEVNEKSGPGFEIVLYPSGALGVPQDQGLAAMKENLYEIGDIDSSKFLGLEPLMGITNLPCLYSNPNEVLKGVAAIEDTFTKPIIEKKWDSHVLYACCMDEQVLYVVPPIERLEQVKGLKIRTFSAPMEMVLKEMGVYPVSIPYPEQYSAMERHVVDGATTGLGAGVAMHFEQVASTVFYGLGLLYFPVWVAVSGKAYRELPNKYRKVLDEVAAKYVTVAAQVSAKQGENLVATLKSGGMKAINASPQEVARTREIANKTCWADYLNRTGPEGAKLLNLVKSALGIQ